MKLFIFYVLVIYIILLHNEILYLLFLFLFIFYFFFQYPHNLCEMWPITLIAAFAVNAGVALEREAETATSKIQERMRTKIRRYNTYISI